MYNILIRENEKWEFAKDSHSEDANFETIKEALTAVRNLLDFYARADIKIIQDIKFITHVELYDILNE